MIYLDNCATTKPRGSVVEKMMEVMNFYYGNPSSLHRFGLQAENSIKSARKTIAKFLNVLEDEIVFTSGGTESNNLVLYGLLEKDKFKHKNIVTSELEHSSIKNYADRYKAAGYEIRYVPVNSKGEIVVSDILDMVDSGTLLVALSHVNNELGSVLPLDKISSIKETYPNVHIHIDGVQGFGKIPIDIKSSKIDSYSFSGHKIHGPKGIGGLFLSRLAFIPPASIGGGQEHGMRSGTENVPGILGLEMAVSELVKNGKCERIHVSNIRSYCIEKLNQDFKDFMINSPIDGSPYILNFSFLDTRGEVILHYLEQKEIYISTASACSSHSKYKVNPVLKAIGLKQDYIDGTIRVCFSKDITREDIDYFIEALKVTVEEIQSIMRR